MQQQPLRTRCGFCYSKNPGSRLAFTHALRDENGCNVCPFLAVNICNMCMMPGHTAKNCTYDGDMLGVQMDAGCRIGECADASKEFEVIMAREHIWMEKMRITQAKNRNRLLFEHMRVNGGKIAVEFMESHGEFSWCRFCYNKNPCDPICATHTTYDSLTNKPHCPHLLCTQCPKCDQYGHTAKFCKEGAPKRSSQPVSEEILQIMGDLDQYELDFDIDDDGDITMA